MSASPRTQRAAFAIAVAAALVVALAAALAVALLLPAAAHAREKESAAVTKSPNQVTSGDLVEEPKKYDGQTLEFAGEAIGQAMKRGDMAWVHVNDDAYYLRNVEEGAALGGYNSGMPVWLPWREAAIVGIFGSYTAEGDVVVVHGTFNAACAEHGGDMDIHATSLEVLEPGREVQDPVHPRKALAVLVLLPLAAFLWWLDGRLTVGTPTNGRHHPLRRALRG